MPFPLLLHSKHGKPAGDPVTYQVFGPWIVPWRFTPLQAEYAALRTGAGLIDYSAQGFIEVGGRDKTTFLHNLLTQDIKRLAPGEGSRAALLTPNAKLIAELLVLCDATSLWLMLDAQRAAVVAETLERYHFSEDVTITNHERSLAVLALQGPQALDALTGLAMQPIPLASLAKPGDHARVSIHAVPTRLIRYDMAGEPGLLCWCGADDALPLWNALTPQGAPGGLMTVGWEALNTARIEAGVPWFGIDMDETHLLPETGLAGLLAGDTKGCYVGQEVVARMQTYGSASKRLMGLQCAGRTVPQPGDLILSQEEPAGAITSACWSPSLNRPIALGYVKRGAYEPGTPVEIVSADERLNATVTSQPLVAVAPRNGT